MYPFPRPQAIVPPEPFNKITARDYPLVARYQAKGDEGAFARLLHYYEPLIKKMAGKTVRQHGGSYEDYMAAGQMGFLVAIQRFDMTRGLHISTYAIPWIRAHMQAEIYQNSPIKLPNSSYGKKIVFNVGAIKRLYDSDKSGANHEDKYNHIAQQYNVPVPALKATFEAAVRGSVSLDAAYGRDADGGTYANIIADDAISQEEALIDQDRTEYGTDLVKIVMQDMNERERYIFERRRLREDEETETLDALGQHFNISKERVRQIEQKAFEKVKKALLKARHSL